MADYPKHLIWRCRRGVRELDVLFGRFLETVYPQLNDQEALDFERLLEVQDPILMDWLFGKSDCDDPALASLIARLHAISGL